MKRYLIGVFAAILLAAIAAPARAGTTVMQVSYGSMTVTAISISSATMPATSIPGGPGNGWRQLCVQNVDTASALFCSDTANVSTDTTKAAAGNIIPPAVDATHPAAPLCWIVVEGMDFFCHTGSTSGPTRAIITKAR